MRLLPELHSTWLLVLVERFHTIICIEHQENYTTDHWKFWQQKTSTFGGT